MANKKAKINKQSSGAGPSKGQSLNLLSPMLNVRQGSSRVSAANDLRKLTNSTRVSTIPIAFGKNQSSGKAAASSGSASGLTNLLGKTSSGGVSGLLGGGLLSLGINSLFSGIADLFGGSTNNAPPPVQKFSLPQSQQETIFANSGGLPINHVANATASRSVSGTYGYSSSASNQAAVVQAVKNALLTSSSLNDVISEL